jgi:hypothetical protein
MNFIVCRSDYRVMQFFVEADALKENLMAMLNFGKGVALVDCSTAFLS